MQQGLGYATALDVPFVFSSNGDGFLFHDRTGTFEPVEQTLSLDEFPSPDELWTHYKQWKSLETVDETLITGVFAVLACTCSQYWRGSALSAAFSGFQPMTRGSGRWA